MAFRKEPPYTHGTLPKTAVLLVNLGTPEAPTAAAVRRYLKEFLWDRRVVEIPRAVWWLILNGIILPIRSKKSAQKYASIWSNDGSPLKVHTQKQATLLRGYLGERGHAVRVEYAMRYGTPSVASVLESLQADGLSTVFRRHHGIDFRRGVRPLYAATEHSRAAPDSPLSRRPGLY
jgi:ferrochelatase